MFGPQHYVPILRWKRAERFAVEKLPDCYRARVTPLLEPTPWLFEPPSRANKSGQRRNAEEVIVQISRDILKHWGNNPLFCDFWHVSKVPDIHGRIHPLVFLAEQSHNLRLNIIPVTGIVRPERYQEAVTHIVRENPKGVCIRVHPGDIRRPTFQGQLQDLLGRLKLSETDVDLLLDCQDLNGVAPDLVVLVSAIPRVKTWRTLTVSCGAFPKDLGGLKPGIRRIQRLDWISYKKMASDSGKLARIPSYSDYTIQHAQFEEPREGCNFSASIRYAVENEWLIMRGEGVRNPDGPGYYQWPAQAQLLCEQQEFMGEPFSEGDRYISEMGRQSVRPGNAETWLKAGINHHMTLAVCQIANLRGV